MGIFGGSAQDQVDLDHLRDRVARLEAAVTSLQEQLAAFGDRATGAGAQAGGTPDWMAEVRELKARGNVIGAIKVYREHTGLGLAESKDAVEALV